MEMGNFLNHVKMAGVLVAGICFLVPGFSAEVRVSEPIPLDQVANMGFADDVAGDGKGGWTDQGAENDLSMLPVGRHRLGGIDFEIIDPAKNNGRSVLTMRAANFPVATCDILSL